MGGWTCPDRDLQIWDGTLQAKKFISEGGSLDDIYVNVSGDEMTGDLTFGNGADLNLRGTSESHFLDLEAHNTSDDPATQCMIRFFDGATEVAEIYHNIPLSSGLTEGLTLTSDHHIILSPGSTSHYVWFADDARLGFGNGGTANIPDAYTSYNSTRSAVEFTSNAGVGGGTVVKFHFNPSGADCDFQASGDADSTLFYVNAGTDRVGIGTNNPVSKLDVNGLINMNGYTVATLPAGTQGDIAFVTDALAPAFLTAVAGGGAVVTPVFYDGTNWVAF